MKLKVIGSGSSGNAYLLQAEDAKETLLIEAGVHISQIKKALNFDLKGVSALVSHSHNDHSRSMKDLLNAGIDVYASADTHAEKGTSTHHRSKFLDPGKMVHIAGFKVKSFSVNHDVQTLGFLISHSESGLTLFLTDTFYCDFTFTGLNNIIVEANHCQEIINENGTPQFLRDRIYQSHMNIQVCKDLLLANDLSQVNNVVLIHLSNDNSDAKRFKKEIADCTGKTVTVAEPGLSINFNKEGI